MKIILHYFLLEKLHDHCVIEPLDDDMLSKSSSSKCRVPKHDILFKFHNNMFLPLHLSIIRSKRITRIKKLLGLKLNVASHIRPSQSVSSETNYDFKQINNSVFVLPIPLAKDLGVN